MEGMVPLLLDESLCDQEHRDADNKFDISSSIGTEALTCSALPRDANNKVDTSGGGRGGTSSTKSSTDGKRHKKEHAKKKHRGSDSSTTTNPGFGLLKKKEDAARSRPTKNEIQKKIDELLAGSFQEVDEGQLLTVKGVVQKNCCLALAVTRAAEGLNATRTEVHKKAQAWMENLPRYLEHGVAKNEAAPGEMLYEDYLNKVVDDDESRMVFLVVASQNVTRVWAGPQASLSASKAIFLKLAMPPVQGFSFIGSTEFKDQICEAQKTVEKTASNE
ncbi:unnamed protein product [Symbiodinium sp. CCMP2592]|nr:unnamed protein product [Symbiodinium sp. CCMP2592]